MSLWRGAMLRYIIKKKLWMKHLCKTYIIYCGRQRKSKTDTLCGCVCLSLCVCQELRREMNGAEICSKSVAESQPPAAYELNKRIGRLWTIGLTHLRK